jgi:hypothetical protein
MRVLYPLHVKEASVYTKKQIGHASGNLPIISRGVEFIEIVKVHKEPRPEISQVYAPSGGLLIY